LSFHLLVRQETSTVYIFTSLVQTSLTELVTVM
jgi:hypothetical protein